MDIIYLDSNATTRPAPEVVSAMMRCYTELWGNPNSAHRFGQLARAAVDEARFQLATLVNVKPAEMVFTGGGTEAINAAIRATLAFRKPRNRFVTSEVEHSATKELANALERDGMDIVRLPVDREGLLDEAAFEASLTDDTAMVSLMWANNETGVLFPVQKVSEMCRERGIPVHIDLTQSVGKIPVDLQAIGCDMASFAAHKFHGPKGIGALFLRRGTPFSPLVIGGPQERQRRGGTENVPGIVGMGAAAELAGKELPKMAEVAKKRDRFQQMVIELIDDVHVNGSTEHRLPNTANLAFSRLSAEAILMSLSEQGICASAGAACSSGSLEPSHVIRAMNVPAHIAHGSVRFSLSRYTTNAEIDQCLAVLPGIVERLRAVLPVG